MTHKEYHVSWDKIFKDSIALADALQKKSAYQGMVAITRGGLMPACIVANRLNVKVIETYGLSSYDAAEQATDSSARGKIEVTKELELAGDGTGWVVIDDLVDSGETLRFVREKLPKATYGVLYAKPKGEDAADIYIEKVEQATWVFFPWENYE